MNSGQDNSSQSTSLTTLIGYITGPKAEQPTGIRVVEPPPGTRQHQRGNLYIVVEVAGSHPDRTKIVDHLLSVVQRGYYSLKGSQSQVMLGALKQARQSIAQINAQYPELDLQAGILSAALLNGRLLVATMGSAFALVRTHDKVHMFPSEIDAIASGDGYYDHELEIFREVVAEDDVIFVGGGSWLRKVPIRTLASVVAFTNAENCTDAADELYDQSDHQGLPGLLIVLEADRNGPDSPTGGPRPTTGTGGGPRVAPRPRRPRLGGLPTALSATPPVRTTPSKPARHPPPSATGPPAAAVAQSRAATADGAAISARVGDMPADHIRNPEHVVPTSSGSSDVVPPDRQPTSGAGTSSLSIPQTLSNPDSPTAMPADTALASPEQVEVVQDVDTSEDDTAQVARKISAWAAGVATIGSASLARTRQFVVQMLPERSEESGDAVDSEAMTYAAGANGIAHDTIEEDVEDGAPVGTLSAGTDDSMVAQPLVDDGDIALDEAVEESSMPAAAEMVEAVSSAPLPGIEPFTAPEPASGARARLLILVAIAILAIVPAVVAVVYWGEGMDRSAEAAQLTDAAEASSIGAQLALDLGDKANARENLTDAQEYLTRAIELDGTNEKRNQLAAEIEAELQEVLQLVPLYSLAEPLVTFSGEARPHRVLVVGEDIYVLDSGRQMILRYELDPDSGFVENQEGQVVLQQGDLVGGSTVGTLADMAWLPLIPGFEDRPSLLILDRNNNVFRYDQRVEGASKLDFAGQPEWRSAGQIQTYLGRVYIVDEAAGEIYRYSPGQYAVPPELWFSEQTQVNLAGVTATEIDGDIWMLFSNGMILRYRAGEQVPFSMENSVGLADEPVDMYVTTQDRALIYLVDAAQDRIMVYNKDGSYQYQLVAPEDQMLRGLSSVYIDEVGGTLFILTQTALFKHPLPD